jgi:hypothetical protein
MQQTRPEGFQHRDRGPRIGARQAVLPAIGVVGGPHNGAVAWRWDFWRRSAGRRATSDATHSHLEEFLATRHGVEAFLEPATTMASASLVLVAWDGEWTRRSVESPQWARGFAARHGLPIYDAGVVGYPQRMRDYNARRRHNG